MKKAFFIILFILLGSISVWSREFDDIKKSAEKGNFYDQFVLSVMYYEGEKISKDYKQSLYWLTKSAEQEYDHAQYSLGLMYAEGKRIPKNYNQAYIWLILAAAQVEKIAAVRDFVAKNLSPQQIVEAQELAAEMQKKIEKKMSKMWDDLFERANDQKSAKKLSSQ